MISFNLVCDKGHDFEAWFKDGASFDRQAKKGLVACSQCGSAKVRKAVMAPAIAGTKRSRKAPERQAPAREAPAREAPAATPEVLAKPVDPQAAALMQQLRELRRKVEESSDYVGDKFAEEARKMHYDEVERRSIHGEATDDEARALADEGVEFARIPWVPRTNS
jgi:hypothetical protein